MKNLWKLLLIPPALVVLARLRLRRLRGLVVSRRVDPALRVLAMSDTKAPTVEELRERAAVRCGICRAIPCGDEDHDKQVLIRASSLLALADRLEEMERALRRIADFPCHSGLNHPSCGCSPCTAEAALKAGGAPQ